MIANARVAAKGSLAAALTSYHVARLEVERLAATPNRRRDVTRARMATCGKDLLRAFGVEVSLDAPRDLADATHPACDANGIGYIFVMNHRAMLDIVVGLVHLAPTFVSRLDVASWPLVGHTAKRIGTLFVDRASKQSGERVVDAMGRTLRSGRSVLVFAEGTTCVGDDVRPFRTGAFRAAEKAGASVVPVGIAYDHDALCWGEQSFGDHMRAICRRSKIVVGLSVGNPIKPEGSIADLSQRARDEVQALVRSARSRITR